MKRLKTGAVNSISFIRNLDYAINSFDVTFEKVVGPTVLSLTNLQDSLELSTCSDFIVLNIDLVTHSLEGGEYYLTVSNGGNSSTYLCEVQAHQYNTLSSNSIYSDSVVLSSDVTAPDAVENDEAVENPDSSTISERFGAEQVKIFVADSLSDAQTVEPTLAYGTNIFGSGTGITHSLSALADGTKKIYVYSTQSGSYIYWAGATVLTNPNGFTGAPFTSNMIAPHYKTVELVANQIKEIDAFGNDGMFPVLTGLNGAEILIETSITRLDYVKDGNYNATINPSLDLTPFAYSRKPAWTNNGNYDNSQSGGRVAIYAALINDDV